VFNIVEIWKALVGLFAQALLVFQNVTGSWGLGIIMLTVLMRVLILPLTIRQTKAMHEMQRLQPKIKEIQQKYKDDKKKQQEEMLKFYSEHKFNPLGGCLPLLLQFPVFIALFTVLKERTKATLKEQAVTVPILAKVGAALTTAKFLGIGLGTSAAILVKAKAPIVSLIPNFILIGLMVGSQYLHNKTMEGGDQSQAKMMNFMLIMMGYLAYIFPAGLIIYWVTSNIIAVIERYLILKFSPQGEPAKQGAK